MIYGWSEKEGQAQRATLRRAASVRLVAEAAASSRARGKASEGMGAGCAHGFCSTVSSGRHMLSSITRRESSSSAASPEIVGFGFQERTFAVSSSKARPGPELSV